MDRRGSGFPNPLRNVIGGAHHSRGGGQQEKAVQSPHVN
jgi:hypothetical protein